MVFLFLFLATSISLQLFFIVSAFPLDLPCMVSDSRGLGLSRVSNRALVILEKACYRKPED